MRRDTVLLLLLLALTGQLLFAPGGEAMNTNYNRPYGTHIGWGTSGSLPTMTFFSPQSEDLIFGDVKEIVIRCSVGLRTVGLKWTLARNQFRKTFLEGTGEPLADNSFLIRIDAAALKPGLYDLRVKVDTGDRQSVEGRSTFGYRVMEMKPLDYRPADFADFWARARREIDGLPLETEMGPVSLFDSRQIEDYNLNHAFLPASYDPQGLRADRVEARQVSFNGARGRRVVAWLAKPEGKGPFPAMIVMPGGGSDTRPMPLEHARHGFLALDVSAFGDLPPGYEGKAADPREIYPYLRYLDALQAVNFIVSLPEVDKSRIVVVGQSWGGCLTLITAALDPRVSAIVPGISYMAYGRYAAWAREGKTDGMVPVALPPLPATEAEKTAAYYDTLNFAPDIKCPVFMTSGLIDDVSPAEGVYSVFSRLGSERKVIQPLTGIGHFWAAEADRRAWRWLESILKQ